MSTEGAVAVDTGSVEAAPVETPVEETKEVKPEETPAQVQANKKKFKLKVDGEEIEDEIDLNDEKELTKRLQLSRAAQKRMAEAVEAKRKAYEIVKAFEDNPESMLKRLGPKGREIAEKYLLEQIQEDMIPAEERERRELKKKLETYEQKEAREKEEREKAIAAQKEYEYAQQFQNTIISALNKSGLPKTPELVKRMAAVMSKNLEYGLELTPDDLVAEVKNDITSLLKSIINDADGDNLIELFGNDTANKIRKADLKKLQERQGQLFQTGKKQVQSSEPRQKSKGYKTMDEWKEEIERKIQE